MKKSVLLLIAFLILGFQGINQTISIQSVTTGLPCHYINVSLTASGFPSGITSVYIVIDLDPNALQYVNKIFNGVLPSTGTQVGPGDNYDQVIISWSSLTGISINGTLLTIVLHYDGGTTIMEGNEVLTQIYTGTPPNLQLVTESFNDGTVSEGSYTFNTYYVDYTNGNDGNNGLSWGSAFKTITRAANIPPIAGEQVIIKPNTYPEKVIIKSNAGYAVKPTPGVILSDTNKITFPGGANLACVNLASYPDQYYAYVYRSWNSNNGYYKIIEVNDAQNYVRVEGASFIPETGVANTRYKVSAAIGRPVIYKKDPTSLENQRVIVNAPVGTTQDAFYIGIASGDGQTDADSCDWNIIEGIDINNTLSGLKGLHIQCSHYNVFAKGKIYCSAGTGGTGLIITGNNSSARGRHAKYNIIQNNEIYNTPNIGILMGYTSGASQTNNYANFNHIIDNNIYMTTGDLAKFNNAIKIENFNKGNVIEGNNIHDIKILTANNGAILVNAKTDSTLIYNNILKNIGKESGNSGINACIQVDSNNYKTHIYNNIIFSDDTVYNAVYAFRLYGRRHFGSKVCFNTIYKVENGFYLQDLNTNNTSIDFAIQDNIISPITTYFTNVGTPGRFTVTYNLYRLTPGTYVDGNITGDPQFIDPDGISMYGLMLQPTSPAINTGTAISGISRDYINDSRNVSMPSMGAFENTMNCIWTGANSTDWHTYQNWKYLIVPKSYTGVTIPNVTNDPVVSLNNASCKSVSISSGASLIVAPNRTLTLNN